MSTPGSERLLDSDCPYCLLQREIIAIKFSLFKPCTALFVCPSCGSSFADVDGPSNKRGRSWHLKAYLSTSQMEASPRLSTLARRRQPALIGAGPQPMAPPRVQEGRW